MYMSNDETTVQFPITNTRSRRSLISPLRMRYPLPISRPPAHSAFFSHHVSHACAGTPRRASDAQRSSSSSRCRFSCTFLLTTPIFQPARLARSNPFGRTSPKVISHQCKSRPFKRTRYAATPCTFFCLRLRLRKPVESPLCCLRLR
jgi:hypothetical protein